jgi:N6-L-threonylcarbamoyladenine synthase
MLVLGIETSCDETACAIVKDGKELLSNVIESQIELHRPFGGVFPEIACRKHVDVIIPVIQEALAKAGVLKEQIDLIAVTQGPGLIGALLIGLNTAKALSLAWNIPFVGVNHVDAHLYAAMMHEIEIPFPALGLVISGGHTLMVKMSDSCTYERIGTTQDDAVGEAFDKVASLLGLPYPGGPAIEQLAKTGRPGRFQFHPGKVKGRPFDFSFSGLKTNVRYAIKGMNAAKDAPLLIKEEEKADVAMNFQEIALTDIVCKSLAAACTFDCRSLICGGGVANNQRLKELFELHNSTHLPLFFPTPALTTDNAAMIAGLGFHTFNKTGRSSLCLEPFTAL